jgi:diketogulonate reductase-like aldo/keto reductase
MRSATALRHTTLRSGEVVPVLGQGTWGLAEGKHPWEQELVALRVGLDLGMTLIDTAEMYADGEAERLIGEAIKGRRDDVFLVDKVLPKNATRQGTVLACEQSLRRLGTDSIDLYLLHWREHIPLQETVAGFTQLAEDGKIENWGVSNFDIADMEELQNISKGQDVATDQVLYNLIRRGIEFDLLPWCHQRDIPIMAYSPIEQGRLLDNPTLVDIAVEHSATPAQIALAWVLRHDKTIAIPRSGTVEHVKDNRRALEIRLTREELEQLDVVFPPPTGPQPLQMI